MDPSPIVLLPSPSSETLIWSAVAFACLFSAAVVFEYIRRRAAGRRTLASKWRLVREIVQEKAVSDDDWSYLRSFLRRRSPSDPLRPITVRQSFEKCVTAEMSALEGSGTVTQYAETGALLRALRVQLGLDYVPLGQQIATTRELFLGQSIWISPVSDSTPTWLRTSLDHIDEASMRAAAQEDATAHPLWGAGVGTKVLCRLWHEDDARYVFTVGVVRFDGEAAAWTLRHATDLKRMQSRGDYRIRHDQTLMAGIVNAPVDDDYSDVEQRPVVTRVHGRITSLSAGGFALITEQALPRQVLLRVSIELRGTGGIEATARIVSTSGLSGGAAPGSGLVCGA